MNTTYHADACHQPGPCAPCGFHESSSPADYPIHSSICTATRATEAQVITPSSLTTVVRPQRPECRMLASDSVPVWLLVRVELQECGRHRRYSSSPSGRSTSSLAVVREIVENALASQLLSMVPCFRSTPSSTLHLTTHSCGDIVKLQSSSLSSPIEHCSFCRADRLGDPYEGFLTVPTLKGFQQQMTMMVGEGGDNAF